MHPNIRLLLMLATALSAFGQLPGVPQPPQTPPPQGPTTPPQRYRIEGTVTANGRALVNAIVSLPPNPQTLTDLAGRYSFRVDRGYSGTISVFSAGYTFSPVSVPLNNVIADILDLNFSGTQPPVPGDTSITVSGNVRSPNGPVPGVPIVFRDGPTVTTDGAGSYRAQLPRGYSGSATAARGGWTFSPSVRTYQDLSASQENEDYQGNPPPASVTIEGSLRQPDGSPIASGRTMLSNGGQFVTGPDGRYSLSVPRGFSGSISVLHESFEFVPAGRDYRDLSSDVTGQDFTGTARPLNLTISGTVKTAGGALVGDVSITGPGLGSPVRTDAQGRYSLLAPTQYVGVITATHPSYRFDPPSRSVSKLFTNLSGMDFTAHSTLPVLRVDGCPVPPALVGRQYRAPFTAVGAAGQLDWSINPALPAGLRFDRVLGEISGIPERSGKLDITVSAATNAGQRAQTSCTLSVEVDPSVTSGVCERRPAGKPNPNAKLAALVLSEDTTASACVLPDQRSGFLPTAEKVVVTFLVDAVNAGDQPAVQFVAPDGKTFTETAWPAFAASGDYCLRAALPIAGTSAVRLPGLWRVRATVNGSSLARATFALAAVDGEPLRLANLSTSSNGAAGECPSRSQESLFRLDDTVFANVAMEAPSDGILETEFISPGGAVFRSFAANVTRGPQCVRSSISLADAGRERAGPWAVRAKFNGAPLATSYFESGVADEAVVSRMEPVKGAGCLAPPSANGIATGESGWFWFLAGVRKGSRASVDWKAPDGSSIQQRFSPAESDGKACFSARLDPKLSGIWHATALVDGDVVARVPFVVGPSAIEAYAVTDRPTGCAPPAPIESFSQAEPVSLWIRSEASASDTVTIDWLAPDSGNPVRSTVVQSAGTGSVFFTDRLPSALSRPGAWVGRLSVNGEQILRIPFHVGAESARLPGAARVGPADGSDAFGFEARPASEPRIMRSVPSQMYSTPE